MGRLVFPPNDPEPDHLPELRRLIAYPDDALPTDTSTWLHHELWWIWITGQETLCAPEVKTCPPYGLEVYIDLIADEWETVRQFYLDHHAKLHAARELFITNALKLTAIRVLGPTERPKHYPPGGTSTAEVTRLTAADGQSRFFPNVTPVILKTLLEQAIQQRIETLWPPPSHAVFDIDVTKTIGVSGSGATTIVRFDCHFDTRVAHAYPIASDEAKLEIEPNVPCIAEPPPELAGDA